MTDSTELGIDPTWAELELATVAAGIEAQLPDRCKLTTDEILKCARAAIIATEVVRDQFVEENDVVD